MATNDAHVNWRPGWTLSAPVATLFQETSSPLLATLAGQPGAINLSSPDAGFCIQLHGEGPAECHIGANGFRITFSPEGHDRIASAVMVDAATLLIEGDRNLLSDLLEQPEFEKTIDESFYFNDEGQHRLGIMVDLTSNPLRVVIVSGTGSGDTMSARARGHLHQSAHNIIDVALQDVDQGEEGQTPDPVQFIRSRLRPATHHIPNPWPADDDSEPVWRLSGLFPAFMALLTTDPDAAAGMVGNLIETMQEDGSIAVAGGNISPMIYGTPDLPLLATMCNAYRERIGRMPTDTGRLVSALRHYLRRAADGSGPDAAPLLRLEKGAFYQIAKAAGRLNEKETQAVLRADLDDAPGDASPSEDPVTQILSSARNLRKSDTSLTGAATAVTKRLQTDLESTELPGLTALTAFVLAQNDYAAFSAWTASWADASSTRWAAQLESGSSAVLFAEAGLLAYARHSRVNAFNPARLREQRVYQFVGHNRKRLAVAGALALIAFAAFIVSVLMRTTMPLSVYETNLGMVMQFYQSEQYDAALEQIAGVESRGHAENVRVRFLKGKTLFKLDNYEAAAEEFEFCMEKRPDYPAAPYNLALCRYRQGRYQAATEQFERIVEKYRLSYPTIAAYASSAAAISREALGEKR